MVCIMLPVGKVLADDPTGNAEQGESVYRTYCLNGHGVKDWGDGPVAVSLRPRPADLISKMLQKKTEKEFLKNICEGKSETTISGPIATSSTRSAPRSLSLGILNEIHAAAAAFR